MLAIPQHVAIIMDGNGRWGENHGLDRTAGHYEGVKRAEEIVLHAKALGIKYVTLFAFSTENWQRPGYEVSVIKRLGKKFMLRRLRGIDQEKIGIRIIGRREDFSLPLRRMMAAVEENTKLHTDFILQVALSYGGRQEIVRAMNLIIEKMRAGELPWQEVTTELIERFLYTSGVPDPDLIIRTGGETRTSNFLPWQSIYAEWIFPKILWPDFHVADFFNCINEYQKRERRLGKVPDKKVG